MKIELGVLDVERLQKAVEDAGITVDVACKIIKQNRKPCKKCAFKNIDCVCDNNFSGYLWNGKTK
jgi:hypothetical protein